MGFIFRISSAKFLFVMVVMSMSLLSSYCEAYEFSVGGRDGNWVVNPPENYNHWAERTRFQVNDTIAFNYKNGSDSVLVVNRDDYFSCNISNPILSLTDGNSVFTFDRSGPFFFISGNADNCNKGLKLIIVVLAIRPKPKPGPQSPTPSPSPSPSSTTPPSLAPAASPAPATQPPSAASPPARSPGSGRAPADLDPPPSPSPVARVNSSASTVVLGFGFSVLAFTVGLVAGF